MPARKKFNWFQKNEYIATWLSLGGVVLGIIAFIIAYESASPLIHYLQSGTPAVVVSPYGCHINRTKAFDDYVEAVCSTLLVSQRIQLPQGTVSQYLTSPDSRAIIEVNITRESPEICYLFTWCHYYVTASDAMSYSDTARVNITSK